MPKTRGTGLLMLWTDVDAAHEAEFNRWYNEEHLHHLLKVPGFLSAGRYEAISGGPKYLAMYELEDVSALRTSAFLDEVRFRPSPWRTKASGGHVGRNYLVQGYRQIFPARTNPVELTMGPSPYLQMGRMDIPAAFEEEWNAWYSTVYVPDYLNVPGVIRARRYMVVDGQPKYHRLRVRAGGRAEERGVEPGAGSQSLDASHPALHEARRGLARRLQAHLPRPGLARGREPRAPDRPRDRGGHERQRRRREHDGGGAGAPELAHAGASRCPRRSCRSRPRTPADGRAGGTAPASRS